MLKNTLGREEKQEALEKSWEIKELCLRYLTPLLSKLDQVMDARLVNTLFDLVLVIVIHRDRHQGLILSELGGELFGEKPAPAGSKRISNLLHSKRWQAEQIEAELWQQGDQRVEQLECSNDEALVIWDESEVEKPESLAAEGLCPVRSSKARRLKRIKPGFYNPPGGRPIFVPGYHWLQVVVVGMKGAARLVHLHWWTTRGPRASDKRMEEFQVLRRVAQLWGRRVVHVFDQGYAGAPWLGWLLLFQLRFVMRWKKDYTLIGPHNQILSARRLVAWKRSLDHRAIWDAPRHCWRTIGIFYLPVRHPAFPNFSLWLVVSRPGSGRKPWFLLTNDPIYSVEDAWHIVFVYARRWQVEMTLRFEKSELAFEAPRLQDWEARQKFLLIACLVHAFLILLLAPRFERLKRWLLDAWCRRNGKWSRETPTPLYRLRLALSQLWRSFPPVYPFLLNSG
jgi:hypothetical protein